MVSAVAERYGLWDDEIFVTVVKRVTQAASPASLQLHERVCVSTGLQVPLRQDEAGGQGYEQGRKRALHLAESASAVICAVETQFLYLFSWF